MKNQTHHKLWAHAIAAERKQPHFRSGTKPAAHRYERRKIREQLRHLDWALAGAD